MFDIKIDFSHKYRWAIDGHKTLSPIGATHVGAVSRGSARIYFAHSALNKLDVFVDDAINACLQAPSFKNHYAERSAEFGPENMDKRGVIRITVHSGKLAGRDL